MINLKELHLIIRSPSGVQTIGALSKLEKIEIESWERFNFSQFLKQSASAQTVQHLKIDGLDIDEGFVDGLSCFHNLCFLSLTTDSNAADVSHNVWTQLHQLNQLIDFNLNNVNQKTVKKFGQYLTGAHHSLQAFSLNIDGIDDNLVVCVAQFVNLQQLQLHIKTFNDVNTVNWQPFQRSIQFKEVTLMNKERKHFVRFPRNFLNNLISLSRLEKLEISGAFIDPEHIQTIGKFTNLIELYLDRLIHLSATKMKIFGQLKYVRKFTIFCITIENLSGPILKLVEMWQSLEYFEYDNVFPREKLANILKSRNNYRQLTTTVGPGTFKILSTR